MKALLIVDVQNDFLPGGALAVPHGDEVIPFINALLDRFDLIVATKDWHPEEHMSFTHWPVHCVQDTRGAEWPSQLAAHKITQVFYKGSDPGIDSYSAFYDNEQKHETGLASYLKERGVDELYVVGLATDYCVKYTVLDALKLGFKVTVLEEGCRAIGDRVKALNEMQHAGAHSLPNLN
ncbi:MAG: Nicotinamidase [Chlamydiales bacterium]|nr:Nicotinamidase [Chlamydiales bacterium]